MVDDFECEEVVQRLDVKLMLHIMVDDEVELDQILPIIATDDEMVANEYSLYLIQQLVDIQ